MGRAEILSTRLVEKSHLGCNDDSIAHPFERFAQQSFAVTVAVKIRSVEKSDSEIKRPSKGQSALCIIGRTVGDSALRGAANTPRPESYFGNREPRAAERTIIHVY